MKSETFWTGLMGSATVRSNRLSLVVVGHTPALGCSCLNTDHTLAPAVLCCRGHRAHHERWRDGETADESKLQMRRAKKALR